MPKSSKCTNLATSRSPHKFCLLLNYTLALLEHCSSPSFSSFLSSGGASMNGAALQCSFGEPEAAVSRPKRHKVASLSFVKVERERKSNGAAIGFLAAASQQVFLLPLALRQSGATSSWPPPNATNGRRSFSLKANGRAPMRAGGNLGHHSTRVQS